MRTCLVSLLVAAVSVLIGYFAGKHVGRQGHGWGGVPRTLEEEQGWCPETLQHGLAGLVHGARNAYVGAMFLLGKNESAMTFHPSWAGDYITLFYTSAIHIGLKLYKPRHSDSIPLPFATADVPTFRIGHIFAPDIDIDDPVYLPIENIIPRFLWNSVFLPGFNCYMAAMRASPFHDMLDSENNTWGPLLQSGQYARKKDWAMSFYDGYTLFDFKSPAYPAEENNLAKMFWKADAWDDGLEKAMAFDLIGAHRLRAVPVDGWNGEKMVGGETLAFVLPLNEYKDIPLRLGFGKYGVDLYFNNDGLPVMLETTDGRQVLRGDKDWQYWKFVWRCSLTSIITLVDHLHLTHFHAANLLARSTRRALSPNHHLRRVMSIFTFGSVWVNNIAMHTLLGPDHVLHRSTPFADFESLSDAVPAAFPRLIDIHKAILDDSTYEALPAKIKETPYFADGRLLLSAIRKLLSDMSTSSMVKKECKDGKLVDADHMRFVAAMLGDSIETGYKLSATPGLNGSDIPCADAKTSPQITRTIEALLWTVTGWHRHVGTVGDYFSDPDLAGFSWKEGEPWTRPKQAMLMSVVAAFTGTPHPKLIEDFSHVFKGMKGEAEFVGIFKEFRENLMEVQRTVRARNAKRVISNPHMDPALVECSVAV